MNKEEIIVDSNGIELAVWYKYSLEPREASVFQDRIANQLLSVWLTIDGGRPIDILPLLHPEDEEKLISKITGQ